MPLIQVAPARNIGHHEPYYFNNSPEGIAKTHDQKIDWHDLDHGITAEEKLRRGRVRYGVWGVSHCWPEKVFCPSGAMKDYPAKFVFAQRHKGFKVSRPLELYRLAASFNMGVEVEPKGFDKRYRQRRYWVRLAIAAFRAHGRHWRRYYYVKILNTYGPDWSVEVLKAASFAGFPAGPTRDWTIPDRLMPKKKGKK